MINKYAHLGGLAGLALVLLGLIIYSINSVFTVVTNVLIIVGAILLIAFIVLKFKTIKQGMTSRSAKFGSNAALLIIFVFGIIIIVNVLLSRFSYRIDTTSAKIYSLAEQTTKVLRNLDNDVKVIGFFKTGSAQQIEELLLEYSNVSSRFKYELVDPDKKPGLAKRYGIKAYGTLVVESNGKEEKIEKSSEEEITNALISVTRDGIKKVYFTTGHGEKDLENEDKAGFSAAKAAAEDENYVIEKILLAEQDSIPSDCSVLVIAGPQSDFFQKELDMVDSYLEKGGKLLLMLDPGAANGFVKFLTFWGLDVGNDIVVDASGVGQLFGAGPTIPIVSQYEDHVLTKDFNVMTFYPEARSISKAAYAPKGVTATELAKTSPRSWGETSSLTSGKIAFDEGKDLQGPVNILAVVEKDAAKAAKKEDKYNLGTSTTKARLIVFGDSDFASNSYFSVQGNGNMFMNSISWLAENEDLIAIRPRDPEDRRLNLTKKQSKMILYFGVILLPLVVFVIGIVVYRKRK